MSINYAMQVLVKKEYTDQIDDELVVEHTQTVIDVDFRLGNYRVFRGTVPGWNSEEESGACILDLNKATEVLGNSLGRSGLEADLALAYLRQLRRYINTCPEVHGSRLQVEIIFSWT